MFEEVISDLMSFFNLQYDWDGEGADAPNHKSIEDSISFVRCLEKVESKYIPLVCPLSNGAICFTWWYNDLSGGVDIYPNSIFAYYIKKYGEVKKGSSNEFSDDFINLFC